MFFIALFLYFLFQFPIQTYFALCAWVVFKLSRAIKTMIFS